jgi:hypothetical protein
MDGLQSVQPQPLQSKAVIVGQSDRPILPPNQQVETMVAVPTERLIPIVGLVVQQTQHEVVVQSPSSLSRIDKSPDRVLAKSVLMDICGPIKAMTARSRKRKAEKATILTSSPYKNMLEEKGKVKSKSDKIAASKEIHRPTPKRMQKDKGKKQWKCSKHSQQANVSRIKRRQMKFGSVVYVKWIERQI